ncbi:MAG: hypothetical protein AAGD35_07245 [Actinomycetota bacterium]
MTIGPPVDTFAGAGGEENARNFDVSGYAFLARKPRPRTVIPSTEPDTHTITPNKKEPR